MPRKPQLTKPIKTYIVNALACFDRPSEVQAGLREVFDMDVPLRTIRYYLPGQEGCHVSGEWADIFQHTRAAYIENVKDIGIAHKVVRLHRLEKLYQKADAARNYQLVMEIIERAAKEAGDWYTNRRILMGPNNGPVQVEHVLTDEERLARLTTLLERAAARRRRGSSSPATMPRPHSQPTRRAQRRAKLLPKVAARSRATTRARKAETVGAAGRG